MDLSSLEKSGKVYCAFCKIDRKVYRKKRINLQNILLSLILSCLIMFIAWQGFNPKVFLLFAVFLFLSDFFIQLRWRLSIVCPFCKFDPIIYNKNKNKASERVKARLEEIKNKEDFFLSKNPFQNLPVKKVKKEELKSKIKTPVTIPKIKTREIKVQRANFVEQ